MVLKKKFTDKAFRPCLSYDGGLGYTDPPQCKYYPITTGTTFLNRRGIVYQQQSFNVSIDGNGTVNSISVTNSGEFSSYEIASGFSGAHDTLVRSGTVEIDFNQPFDGSSYYNSTITGTGKFAFDESINGVLISGNKLATGTFTGYALENEQDSVDYYIAELSGSGDFTVSAEIISNTRVDGTYFFSGKVPNGVHFYIW